MGLHQPTFLIVLSRILMLMVMTPEDQIWSYISQLCVKTCIVIVLCIWVKNCGIICPSLYNILRVLNHLNRITKCRSWSLARDFFFLTIGLFLYVDLIVVMYMNCIVVDGRTLCKTAFGWWVILTKYVLIRIKKFTCTRTMRQKTGPGLPSHPHDSCIPIRQKAITWASVDQILCRHMVSLGHKELIVLSCLRERQVWFYNVNISLTLFWYR